MQNKLTLRMEESLINQAKVYAKQHGKSLSQIVADYFQLLTKNPQASEIPPVTRSLIGVIENQAIDIDDYKKHLEEKYL